jgi:D-alanine-D-alanine ligase
MAERKMKVGVIFGGRSGEHEVSVMSARSVLAGFNPEKYEVFPIGISRDGQWVTPEGAKAALQAGHVSVAEGQSLAILPGAAQQSLVPQGSAPPLPALDVIFPVIHGTYGEDGTLQGLLEMAGIPYVGAGVHGSAVGMDKALMKSVWQASGIPQVPFLVFLRKQWEAQPDLILGRIQKELGLPVFVKPANLGSSVGISKAKTPEELREAMVLAASYDRKIVIEQAVEAPREVELAVLGNDEPEVSLPGEILHGREWYDYRGKYFETEGQKTIIPADLTPDQIAELQKLAIEAYQALDMNGLSRVDFLIDKEGKFWLNEVNTMPGFTPISMYARLWEATGLSYSSLLDRLVELALERYQDRQRNVVAAELTA